MTVASPSLRIHSIENQSRVNGPGLRCVVWVQGCTLGCPACFNPLTHDNQSGEMWNVADLVSHLLHIPDVEGLTISGGEPLQQIHPLMATLSAIHERSTLSVVLFTGYTWSEVRLMPSFTDLSTLLDVMICGRYDQNRRIANGLIGSENKTLHFLTDRYAPMDFMSIPEAEITILPDGEIHLSGINPVNLGG